MLHNIKAFQFSFLPTYFNVVYFYVFFKLFHSIIIEYSQL